MHPPHQPLDPFSYTKPLLAWWLHGTGVSMTLNVVMAACAAAELSCS